jgi:AGZA family xanthine/uracil permease-like MFS transporter
MGHKSFFAFSVVIGMKVPWRVALGGVAIAGAGVAAGGRTGLASLVTSALFLVALFLFPLVRMIGGLRHIAWDDPTEAIPAFLTLIVMPLAVSITDGIAFGLLAYALLKLATGRGRQVHPLIYIFAALFLARYAWLR